MRTGVPEKLLKIAADIAENGEANLTRLTVVVGTIFFLNTIALYQILQ